MRAILGDCNFIHAGCMLSLPGSEAQPYHQDGPHLHKNHLPVHALNVFVPLVDLRVANGPTEFIPDSHRNYDVDRHPVQFELNAGQCLLFDYRVKHRGIANRSDRPRPVLYFTYAKPFFVDEANFSEKRYREMPPLLQQLADATANSLPRRTLDASSSSSSSCSSSSSSSSSSHVDPLGALMISAASDDAVHRATAAIRASRAQRRQMQRERDDEDDEHHEAVVAVAAVEQPAVEAAVGGGNMDDFKEFGTLIARPRGWKRKILRVGEQPT